MSHDIHQAVQQTLLAATAHKPFEPARYPHAYGYDWVLAHPEVLGLTAAGLQARGDAVSAVLDYCEVTGQDKAEVLITLADGYLAEHAIQATATQRREAQVAKGLTASRLMNRRAAVATAGHVGA